MEKIVSLKNVSVKYDNVPIELSTVITIAISETTVILIF